MKKYDFKSLDLNLRKKLRNEVPRWLVLLIDLYISSNTFLLVCIIFKFLEIGPKVRFFQVCIYQLPIVFLCLLVAFVLTGSYKGIIRHTGFHDMSKVLLANLTYLLLISLIFWLFLDFEVDAVFYFGKAILLVHFLLNTIAMIFLRIFYKNIYSKYIVGGNLQRKVMIYGAGDAGVITYDALRKDERNKVSIVGFIDDNPKKVGKRIDGLRIYSPERIDEEFIIKHEISEIIISAQRISATRLNEIVEKYSVDKISLKIVPPISDWLEGGLKPQQIKPLKIEDLLGRKPIVLNNEEVALEIQDKVILVTGAAGSIGSEIARQLVNYSFKKLILLDQAESALYDLQQTLAKSPEQLCEYVIGNVKNEKRMRELMEVHRPDIIFHSAAYKHVPLMEINPYESVMTNVKGTKLMADLAAEFQAEKFVLISTDKAVNPTNVMGATKRVAELYVTHLNKQSKTSFVVTRFGNVLGSNGSVVPIFKRQIEEGGPLTVTHPEITRFFMTIPEACQLVLEAAAMGKGGEVFVFDMGKAVKIVDLAKKAIRLSGLHYPNDIDIKFIGLRPGEKIYEELLADGEKVIPTHHPKIMIAKVADPDERFNEWVEMLVSDDAAALEAPRQLVVQLKKLVPEYISENSIFCSIDQRSETD